jgi:hypothetical protein
VTGFGDAIVSLADFVQNRGGTVWHSHPHFALKHPSGDDDGMHDHWHAHSPDDPNLSNHSHPADHDQLDAAAQDSLREYLPPQWQQSFDLLEADHAERVRRWEAHSAEREMAEAAMERAHRERAARSGARQPARVAAALDYLRPDPPRLG